MSTSEAIDCDTQLEDTVSYELPPLDTTTYENISADINVYEIPCHDATSSEMDPQTHNTGTYEALSSDSSKIEEPLNENKLTSPVAKPRPKPHVYMNVSRNA